LIVWPHALIEIIIAARHFLQGVCHVKCPLLLLRIEQYREFIRPRDDINHPLMLLFVFFFEKLLCLGPLITQSL